MRKPFTRIRLSFYSIIYLLLLAPAASAHNDKDHHGGGGILEFTENKTQWDPSVKFVTDVAGARIFLQQQGITFALYDNLKADEIQHKHNGGRDGLIDAHAYRVKFLNSSSAATIVGSEKTAGYKNYFLGTDPAKWSSRVNSYQVLEYKELYPKTDLRIFEKEGRMKYEYILQPGADPSKIKMQYEGADGISIKNGELHLQTSIVTVVEQKPYVYQIRNGQEVEVPSNFQLQNGVVSFNFPSGYDISLPLVIDPVLTYSTYSGSSGNNYGYTAAFDSDGFVYSGGTVFAPGFPVTTGAYQITHAGSTDMGLIKYDPDAATGAQSRVFATYIGGNSGDHPHSLVTNANKELIVYGSTSGSFPTTINAFDPSPNGGSDIVVARLNFDGTALLGSTYIGGNSSDGQTPYTLSVNYGDNYRGDVTVDDLGFIYVASTSASTDFPIINGFQSVKETGNDGVVIKLNPDLSDIIWSTFIGGDGDDAAFSVQVNTLREVWVGGGTQSTDLPGTAGGAYMSFEGATDGFAARFTTTGSLVRTTYTGTDQYDQAYFLQLDEQNNVYLFGQTQGSYPVSANVYTNPNSTQFVHKFTADLTSSLWSTVVGSGTNTLNITPGAFLVDDCGQILLSGFGSNMPITPDAYQTNNSGLYIMQLTQNAADLKYGTFFGTSAHVDGGTSRFDKRGNIYHGACVSSGWPSTPNAWAPNNGSSYNQAVMKMAITELDPDFKSTPPGSTVEVTEGCAPLTLKFERISTGGHFYYWNFGDGLDTLTSEPVTHTYMEPGQYVVTHYLFDSTTCQGSAHTSKIITVHGATGTAGPDKAFCNSSSVEMDASGGVSYLWSPATGLSATNIPNPLATPDSTTAYTVTIVDQNGCTNIDTVIVGVDALPLVSLPGTQYICPGGSVDLTISNSPDYTYSWSPATGLNSTTTGTVTANPQATTTYVVDIEYDGCSISDTITVEVTPMPVVTTTPNVQTCAGIPVTLTASGASTYQWSPAAGLDVSTGDTVIANISETTTYTVIGLSETGCADTAMVTVSIGSISASASNSGPVCTSDSATLMVTNVQGATYSWTGPNGFTSQAQQPVLPNVNSQMAGDYTVEVSLPGCLTTTVTTNLVVNQGPELVHSADTTICANQGVALIVSGADSYTWWPAAGLNATMGNLVIAEPEATTTYTIMGQSASGCRDTSTVTITVGNALNFTPLTDTEICPGNQTTLNATYNAAYTYYWAENGSLSDYTIHNPVASPATTTNYVLTISSADCSVRDSVLVVVSDPAEVQISVDYPTGPAPHTVQFTNSTTGANGYIWTFNDGGTSTDMSPAHTFTQTGTYVVNLVTEYGNGCTLTDSISIFVEPTTQPNIFTPNGDGINDVFEIYLTKKPFTLMVFNRWGKVVKEIKDYHLHQNWNGDGLTDGLYFYQVSTNDGEIWKGWVEIMR